MAVTLEDIQSRQQAMTELALRLPGEQDAARVQEIATQLQEQAVELQKLCAAFEQQAQAEARAPRRAGVEVVLTPDQRARIRAETGVEMESVWLEDATGVLNQAMPATSKDQVLVLALAQARVRKETGAAEQQTREHVDRLLQEIDEQGGQVKEKLDELRQDPNFLGGMLQRR